MGRCGGPSRVLRRRPPAQAVGRPGRRGPGVRPVRRLRVHAAQRSRRVRVPRLRDRRAAVAEPGHRRDKRAGQQQVADLLADVRDGGRAGTRVRPARPAAAVLLHT